MCGSFLKKKKKKDIFIVFFSCNASWRQLNKSKLKTNCSRVLGYVRSCNNNREFLPGTEVEELLVLVGMFLSP